MPKSANSLPTLKARAISLLQAGRFQQALDLLAPVCRQGKGDAQCWFLLGALHGRQGNLQEAVACSEQAVRLDPANIDAIYNLGQACRQLGRLKRAEKCFRQVVAARPEAAAVHDLLGYTLQDMGQPDQAKVCYRKALELEPNRLGTQYLLSALDKHADTPERAPDEYVQGLFDGFANRFEGTLVGELGYRIPRCVYELVVEQVGCDRQDLAILDLGCGTGLCGETVKKLSGRLVGVDLSERMLEIARGKAIYDSLQVGEVNTFVQSSDESFDLIIAADVFIYIGDLGELFPACHAALNRDGLFVFSIEATSGHPRYRLQPTNRYAHATAYIECLADACNFTIVNCLEKTIRMQKDQPVPGFVYVLQKEIRG